MGHDLARVDLTDLDIFAGGFPHDIFRLHREQAPAWWHEPTAHMPDGEGIWSVTTYDEVRQVLNDPPTYSSETGCDRPYGGTIFRTSQCPGPPPGHQRSDTGLPGARISPGQKVVVWEGSANRDPRRFDRPDAFLLQRIRTRIWPPVTAPTSVSARISPGSDPRGARRSAPRHRHVHARRSGAMDAQQSPYRHLPSPVAVHKATTTSGSATRM
jgi:cytochrome P450